MKQTMPGCIYIVATPIGNLADMNARSVQVLSDADLIAAEDTRHSRKLLQHFQIHTPLQSLHAHNEAQQSEKLLQRVQQGLTLALISDAGTPLIHDPGYRLIKSAHAQGVKVVPVPGPCALIVALSAAGLPSDQFRFLGFLPATSAARLKILATLVEEPYTLIFYEAPHRVLASLRDMASCFGAKRLAVIARELTKIHETIMRTPLEEMIQKLETDPVQQKGEFVILIAGAPKQPSEHLETEFNLSLETILQTLLKEMPLKQAVKIAVQLTGAPKNSVYKMALELEDR